MRNCYAIFTFVQTRDGPDIKFARHPVHNQFSKMLMFRVREIEIDREKRKRNMVFEE